MFTRADAIDHGLTRKQIEVRQHRDWLSVYEGVFMFRGAPFTPRSLIRAACLAGAPHAAASHRSAAALYEVPGGDPDIAEVTCPRWLRTKHPGLKVHETNRIDTRDLRDIDGIPVMSPERVLIELASIYRSPDFIEVVLHAMLRKRMVTVDSTIATFERLARPGRRGIAVARQVLMKHDASLAVTESVPETLLLQILRDANLGPVETQYVVTDRQGRFVARVDVAVISSKVSVEYDSDEYHSDPLSIARDNARRNKLIAAGWFPVVARKRDLRNRGVELIAAIRALVTELA